MPDECTFHEIFDPMRAGHHQKLVGVTAGSIDFVSSCPGLVIDVNALWAERTVTETTSSGMPTACAAEGYAGACAQGDHQNQSVIRSLRRV